jgi:hypothetical protein
VAAADFNGDNKSDILWHNAATGEISAWLLNGMQFVSGTPFAGKSSASTTWRPRVVADYNANAKPDILWHNTITGQLSIWLLNGTQFVSGVTPSGKSSASPSWTPVG